jgi:hypothetical protein
MLHTHGRVTAACTHAVRHSTHMQCMHTWSAAAAATLAGQRAPCARASPPWPPHLATPLRCSAAQTDTPACMHVCTCRRVSNAAQDERTPLRACTSACMHACTSAHCMHPFGARARPVAQHLRTNRQRACACMHASACDPGQSHTHLRSNRGCAATSACCHLCMLLALCCAVPLYCVPLQTPVRWLCCAVLCCAMLCGTTQCDTCGCAAGAPVPPAVWCSFVLLCAALCGAAMRAQAAG